MLHNGIVYPSYYVSRYDSVNRKYNEKGISEMVQKFDEYKGISVTQSILDNMRQTETYVNVDYKDISYADSVLYTANSVLDATKYRKTGLMQGMMIQDLIERPNEVISFDKINLRLKELEKTNQTEGNEFQKLVKQKQKMEEVGNPEIIFNRFLMLYHEHETMSAVVIAIFMVFMCSSVFSKEYESKMYLILSTTPYGMRRIVVIKFLAVSILSISCIITMNLSMGGIYLLLGSVSGYDASLSSLSILFAYLPYSLKIWQYFLIKMGYQVLAMLTLNAILFFSSIKHKSYVVTVFIGLLVLSQGTIFYYLGAGNESMLSRLSITYGVTTHKIFYKYHTYDFFTISLEYPYVILIFYLLVFILFMWLTFRCYTGRRGNYK